MKRINTKALVEGAILVAVAAVLMIASVYVPFFMLVGVIVWPIPITILSFKYDLKFSAVSLVVLFTLVSLMTNPLNALVMIMMYGIPSVVLGFCLRRNYSSFTAVIAMTISMFIMMVVIIKFSKLLVGQDMMQQMFKLFDESAAKSKEMMRSMGISEQQISQNTALQAMNSGFLTMVFPGILAMASLSGSFINYYVVGKVFKRLRIKINEIKPMDQWYIGNSLSFGIFIITISAWIMSSLKVANSDIAFNSIFIIFNYIFIINGLAVITWYLKNKGLPGKVRVLIIIVILFTPLSNIIFYLGLVDYIIDFRKINPFRGGRIPPGR